MAEFVRRGVVGIRLPDGVVVEDEPQPRTRTRRAGAATTPDDLVTALANHELAPVDRFSLQLAAPLARTVGPLPVALVDVDLAPDEDAALLTEQGGFYHWELPQPVSATDALRRTRRGGTRTARFVVSVPTAFPEDPRPGRRGVIDDIVGTALEVTVLKFVSRVAAGKTMEYFERNLRSGLVHVAGLDMTSWERHENLAEVPIKPEGIRRVLLLLHGTFSSTRGSFGALTQTPWGRELLASALREYDAVLGYDHATLSLDPLANAIDLFARLERSSGPAPLIDAIAFSRGGLVYRSLVEHVLPLRRSGQADRAIFVACTNSGTRFADPENWRRSIDLYTNIAVAATRALGLLPQAHAPSEVLAGVVKGLGAFVKYLTAYALSDDGVPGLAAMRPDGDFIRTLNKVQVGQPEPASTYYYAVQSTFDTNGFGPDLGPAEFPQRLISLVADRAVDRLLGGANDLVVDVPSMTAIDPSRGGFVKDVFDFGPNPHVYHTTYFSRPEVAGVLARWLRVPVGVPEIVTKPTRSRRVRRAPDLVRSGATAEPEMPVQVQTDMLVVEADQPSGAVREAVRETAASYVVVRRGDTRYAYPTDEVLKTLDNAEADESVEKGLDLHEDRASQVRSPAHAVDPLAESSPHATARRGVVERDGHTVGVIPEAVPPGSSLDVASLATRAAMRPTTARPAALPTKSPREDQGRQGRDGVLVRFHAEMDSQLVLGAVTSVDVTVSREAVLAAVGRVTAERNIVVAPDRPVILQMIPKVNVVAHGGVREEIPVPPAGLPATVTFDIIGSDLGDAVVWVLARQGQVALVTLELRATVVPVRAAQRVAPTIVDAVVAPGDERAAPARQLRVYQVQQGMVDRFRYDLDLGRGPQTFESPPLKGSRASYIAEIYRQIEDYWVQTQRDAKTFIGSLRALGAKLFEELFDLAMRQVLWENRANLDGLLLLTEEPFIPWEIVHLKDPASRVVGGQSLFLGELGLVRWLYGPHGWPPVHVSVRPGYRRYVIPEYVDPRLRHGVADAQVERKYLEQKLGATPITAEQSAVRSALETPDTFDLFHFAGHGAAPTTLGEAAYIKLAGRLEPIGGGRAAYRDDDLAATTVEQYANLTGRAGVRPLVVLNACQVGRSMGGFAQAFVGAGAGMFVGALWEVDDVHARTFIETLYDELATGAVVSAAVRTARAAARKAGDATWLAYTVYALPHTTLEFAHAPGVVAGAPVMVTPT